MKTAILSVGTEILMGQIVNTNTVYLSRELNALGFDVMYHHTGMRCWDYNTEILSFGSIDGYVCLRSVLIFGTFGLILMYFLLPFFIYLSKKMNKKTFLIISITLCTIFLCDELYNWLFNRIFDTPRASRIYKNLGIQYMNYYK